MRRIAVILGALLLASLVSACGSGSDADMPAATRAVGEESPGDPVRKSAPAIAGPSLDGAAVALTDYRGRALLVNVWSSW